MVRAASSIICIATASTLALAVSAQTLRGVPSTSTPRELQSDYRFREPRWNGKRVDWCKAYDFRMGPNNSNSWLECGQGAADEYCKKSGYDHASQFERVSQIDEQTTLILQDTDAPGTKHDAFSYIVCTKDAKVTPTSPTKSFDNPTYHGKRVDFCYGYDYRMGPNNPSAYLECGQGAANAFCKKNGYDRATSFTKDPKISAPTIFILQDSEAPGDKHDAFTSITCTQ